MSSLHGGGLCNQQRSLSADVRSPLMTDVVHRKVQIRGMLKPDSVTLEADLIGEWVLGALELTKASVVFEVARDAEPEISLDGFFDLAVDSQRLRFVGGVGITPIEVMLCASMASDWEDAFVKGLTLTKSALQVGFNVETGIPMSIDVMAGMKASKNAQRPAYLMVVTGYLGALRP